jgi:hypothetical protein
MSRRFFRLIDDVYFPHRWHLATPIDRQGRKADCWDFTRGAPVRLKARLSVPIEETGQPLDYSEAGIMVPVVHVRLAAMLTELAPDDVQLFPVDIAGHPDQYLILVATRLIRCIDEPASKVRFWTPEHGVPDMVGQYIAVDNLHIDETKVGNAKVFRPEGWEVALIIAEEIKEALVRMKATGAKFEAV